MISVRKHREEGTWEKHEKTEIEGEHELVSKEELRGRTATNFCLSVKVSFPPSLPGKRADIMTSAWLLHTY